MNEREYLSVLNQIALNYDAEYVNECHDDFCISMRKKIKQLENLIKEHFENPPLQFSDLKIGEPYWDNLKECWLIIESYDPTFRSKEYSWYFDKNGQCYREELYEDEFDENRYYRKRVENE